MSKNNFHIFAPTKGAAVGQADELKTTPVPQIKSL
jgi:hypothetical protein